MSIDIKGKVAIITGAGGGIGRATALKLAQSGMKIVMLGGNNVDKLLQTRSIVQQYADSMIVPGDLTDFKLLSTAAYQAAEKFGRVDLLINNAGMALNCPFDETKESEFDRIMSINVKTPYFLTQKLLPYLRRSDCATVINIGSVVSHAGYPNQSAYVAAKHALLGFTKSLASECYTDGIRVHAVCPGGVYTDMVKVARPDLTDEGMISPEDIADIIHFIVTHRSNAVIDEISVHRANKAPFLI